MNPKEVQELIRSVLGTLESNIQASKCKIALGHNELNGAIIALDSVCDAIRQVQEDLS